MKFTKVLAGMLSAALLLTGCSEDSSSTADSSKADTTTTTTTEATTTTTEATTTTTETTTTAETTTTEETDAGSDEGDMKPEEPASADELAEVKDVIAGYLEANNNKDYAAMIRYYDVQFNYFMEHGETGSDPELVQYMQDAESEIFMDYSNAVFGEPQCYNSMAQEYNDFLASDLMSEVETEDGETIEVSPEEEFKIEGVYVFNVKNEAAGFSSEMDYAVLKINGKWQVDTALTLLYTFVSIFEGMGDLTE
ncbi:MAG: hypothetical protein E7503_07705 [Ruminococcus sp.]|nr:hypothetical protein [Ruminococcus sp.]